ncbi:hypothetical protein K1X84_14185 [bacterium]|nr:hypothetical protein [bacterium]
MKTLIASVYFFSLTIFLVVSGCDSDTTENVIADPTESEIMVGGLSSNEQNIYHEGRDFFFRSFTLAEGLGPFFAEDACGKCHEGAGRGPGKVLRIGRTVEGTFDPMIRFGGPTLQFRSAMNNVIPETVPPEAQFVEFRVAPAIFGRGYIQAIPEETIVANADPNDLNGDGISGRPNYIVMGFVGAPTHPELGRHGLKAQMSRIKDFASAAFLNDLGMTTSMRPYELVNPNAPKAKDGRNGTDVKDDIVDKVEKFIRMSEFPSMLLETQNIMEGKNLFNTIGCQKCHVPKMITGDSDIEAVAYKEVYFYSDFLIHDMGPGLTDGTLDGDALPQEWKTPVLRGMRFFKEFLHDGRALSIDEAIILHGGEAEAIKNVYKNLPKDDQVKLIEFIHSL